MENEKKDRIAEAQAHIFSGAFARQKKEVKEEEREEDTTYRVKADLERSREVLAGFLGGKVFERGDVE